MRNFHNSRLLMMEPWRLMETPCGLVLHKTEFAASTDKVRRTFLNGLYFNLFEDRTEVVATNGVQARPCPL